MQAEVRPVRALARWVLCAAVFACLLASASMSAGSMDSMGSGAMAGMASSSSAVGGGVAGMSMGEGSASVAPSVVGDPAVACGQAGMDMACPLRHGALAGVYQAVAPALSAVVGAPNVAGARFFVPVVAVGGRAPPDLYALAVSRT
jgi:hypothetical protein